LEVNRKKETITLSIPPGTREKLEALARRFQIFWGKTPSPSGLITAIAEGRLEVGQPFTLSNTQVSALEQGIKILISSGYIGEAQTLSSLLLERGNLEAPLRQSVMQRVGSFHQAWRILIDRQIELQQPFRLLYTNSQAQELEYTVRFAQITFIEKQFYLEIWCDETEDISPEDQKDFPELIHNRCLRLDRIRAIVPLEGEWGDGIDFIEVQLHFKGEMAQAYQAKSGDTQNEIVDGIRIVTRKVTNHFWLVREVLPYGDNCNVVTPESIRQRIYAELIKLWGNYSLNQPNLNENKS